MSHDYINMVVYALFFVGQAVCWYEAGRLKGKTDALVTAIDMLKEVLEKA